jgi:hypothetical protein
MTDMWNESDPGKIRGYIDEIFSEDVIFIDPANSIVGRDAVETMVRTFRKRLPEAIVSHSSGFDGHHGLYRYHWEIHPGGELVVDGFDVSEIDSCGRVSRVEGFFGPIPES